MKNYLISFVIAVHGVFMLSANSLAEPDNVPLGRTPAAIVDGQYPASYFPNTELLGADEMRITALGTGMPNQTKAAVSISYLGNWVTETNSCSI
jgi:ribonuclease Z